MYAKASFGVHQALEIDRRCDRTTRDNGWTETPAEEKWHSHAGGNLAVALTDHQKRGDQLGSSGRCLAFGELKR